MASSVLQYREAAVFNAVDVAYNIKSGQDNVLPQPLGNLSFTSELPDKLGLSAHTSANTGVAGGREVQLPA